MRTNRIVNAIIAFVIAGVLAAGVCCMGFASRGTDGKWFGNFKDLSTWHWSDKADENKPDNPDTPDNSDKDKPDESYGGNTAGGALISGSENYGISLLSEVIPVEEYEANGVSPQSDTAYTLTATVMPAEANNKNVTFSVAWKNANSEWANGKNISDYLMITQTATGSNKAILTCLQPFGEQAIVTVVSNYNSSIKATATVDYLKKIISVKSSMTPAYWELTVVDPELSLDNSAYNWSIGTLEDTIKTGYLEISLTDELIDSLLELQVFQGTFDSQWGEYDFTYEDMITRTVTYSGGDFINDTLSIYDPELYLDLLHIGEELFDGEHGEGATGLLTFCLKHTRDGYVIDRERFIAFANACDTVGRCFYINCIVNLKSGARYDFDYSCYITKSDLEYCFSNVFSVPAQSVELDETHIVF